MTKWSDILKNRIEERGFLPLSDYISLSNQHYYASRDPFGKEGDFYTSPELCAVFGEIIAAWAITIWYEMGSPNSLNLIELGPGRGTLLTDFWRIASQYFKETNIEIHLLESSPLLKNTQFKKLSQCHCAINWYEKIEHIPFNKPFILIANEFLDALPIEQYFFKKDYLYQKVITYHSGKFQFDYIPSNLIFEKKQENIIFEKSPIREKMVTFLCQKMQQQKGISLFIDYGYQKTSIGDSLQAVQHHQFIDPLKAPGESDLTSHVDFENLKKIAITMEMSVFGPIHQREFLTQLGFQKRIEQLVTQTKNPHAFLRSARILIDPMAMGEIFKVMAISSSSIQKCEGFSNV